MPDGSELLAVVEQAVAAFRQAGITCFITGSLGGSVHGEFRATNDLDLVADLDVERLPALVERLEPHFFIDLDAARAAVEAGSSFNAIHRETFLKVDVFPCSAPFEREAARRAELVQLPSASEPLRVATKEDILLAKLRRFRLGDETSEVQRRDIRQLIGLNRGDFDLAYLNHWAVSLSVKDLLERFLSNG